MSSHRQIFYHIVFGTKHRELTIAEAYCEELYKYIFGVIKNNNCKLYRINGMEDHIHIFQTSILLYHLLIMLRILK